MTAVADTPAVYHITHWKAGSQWVRGMLADLFPERVRVPPPETSMGVFPEAIEAGRIYSPLYIARHNFEGSPAACVPHRKFVVIRDLRDVLVSWYFSLRYSHGRNEAVERHRSVLEGLPREEGLLYLLEHRDFGPLVAIPQTWVDAGADVLVIRYEALIAETLAHMRRILEHCGLEASDGTLERTVRRWSFQARTGRAPGQEDPHSHYRKGIAGDWQNYFTPRLRESFKARYGAVLERLGYARAADW